MPPAGVKISFSRDEVRFGLGKIDEPFGFDQDWSCEIILDPCNMQQRTDITLL